MEIFKLLTRSTNLQKSAPASRKTAIHNIPSAGVSSEIQTQRNSDNLAHLVNTGGESAKRKRGLENKEQGLDISEQLDFFCAGPQKTTPSTTTVGEANLATGGEQQVQQNNSEPKVTTPVLGEDECRQVLKRNKLKITLLDGGYGGWSEPRKRRKIEHEKAASSKNAHILLSPQPMTSFKQLRSKYKISKRLAENLDAQGYAEPTEVQLGSLPILLGSDQDRGIVQDKAKSGSKASKSHVDLFTVAPTGSGKTLAFMISILHGLLEDRYYDKRSTSDEVNEHQVQALIIAPTHELADQIVNEGRKLASGTGIKVSGMRKGMKLQTSSQDAIARSPYEVLGSPDSNHDTVKPDQAKASFVKADIVVSTPLMLLHALSQDSDSMPGKLPTVKHLVLDEADVLLDTLFRAQTLGIWGACNNPSMQVSLWSATMGSSIESLALSFIDERRHNLRVTPKKLPHYAIRLVVGLKDSAIPNISHRLIYAATEQGKLLALRQLLHPSAAPVDSGPSLQTPFLIFTQTIPRAIALHSELLYDIPPEAGGSSRIAVLHSDLSDPARSAIMANFRTGEIWVLITTDLLSRGVDFRGLNGVVNYDIPNTGASYVHRVGRTGRQGRKGGVAVTFYTKEDIPYVKNIANVIAASERVHAKAGNVREGETQQWLSDVLPAVSKKVKRELKMKGVEGRRSNANDPESMKEAKRMRISTKSGYDRQLENRRKGAVRGSKRRKEEESSSDASLSEDEGWGGIES